MRALLLVLILFPRIASAQILTIPAAEYIRLENSNYSHDSKLLDTEVVSFISAKWSEAYITAYALGAKKVHEANPVFTPFANTPWLAGIAQGAVTGGLSLLIIKEHKKHAKTALIAGLIGTAAYSYIAYHNTQVIK